MTYYPVPNPYQLFTDSDGTPLESGYIYIGEANLNPITNPITVSWDLAGLYPAAQPIRTIGGYPSRNGTPGILYVNAGAFEDYSILIQDKHQDQVTFVRSALATSGGLGGNTVDIIDDLRSIQGYDQPIYVRGHSTIGDSGGGKFEWIDGAAPGTYVDDNGYTIVPIGGDGSGAWIRQQTGPVNPAMWGAVRDGITDDSAAIIAMFAGFEDIEFIDGDYFMSAGVTKTANHVKVNFGNARFINDGVQWLFNFGTTSDTPLYEDVHVNGGFFEQDDPATLSNLNYIRFAGIKNFSVTGGVFKNVSNGGIYLEAGCADGVIDDVIIDGATGYSTCRGIWLNGSTASDYASQLIDITSITRNATAIPAYFVENIKIVNCTITIPFYGCYLINTRRCKIINNKIDISGNGARCIAVNDYSPGTIIKNNTFIGDQTSTGILVTQYSHDVIIEGNNFQGTFGGGRDIYFAYLAEGVINNNHFDTDSTQQILVDMGATPKIRNNFFNASAYSANHRCIRIDTIDSAVAGTSTYGDTATYLGGIVIENNVSKIRVCGVYAYAQTSALGNIPGIDYIIIKNNTWCDFDLATGADEYGLRLTAPGSTYLMKFAYFNNTVMPETKANRNSYSIASGTGYTIVRSDIQFALFRIVNNSGGGSVTSTKSWGANFSCNVSRSVNDLIISPRTIGGGSGASVAIPLTIMSASTNVYRYDVVINGSNYQIRLFDSGGTQLTLSSVAATIDVLINHSVT